MFVQDQHTHTQQEVQEEVVHVALVVLVVAAEDELGYV